MGILISSHRMLQSRVLKGQDLIKWATVTAPSRTFLHELFIFFTVCGGEEYLYSLVPLLNCAKALAVFPAIALAPSLWMLTQ